MWSAPVFASCLAPDIARVQTLLQDVTQVSLRPCSRYKQKILSTLMADLTIWISTAQGLDDGEYRRSAEGRQLVKDFLDLQTRALATVGVHLSTSSAANFALQTAVGAEFGMGHSTLEPGHGRKKNAPRQSRSRNP